MKRKTIKQSEKSRASRTSFKKRVFLFFAIVVSFASFMLSNFSGIVYADPNQTTIICNDGTQVTVTRQDQAFTLADYQAACKNHGGYTVPGSYNPAKAHGTPTWINAGTIKYNMIGSNGKQTAKYYVIDSSHTDAVVAQADSNYVTNNVVNESDKSVKFLPTSDDSSPSNCPNEDYITYELNSNLQSAVLSEEIFYYHYVDPTVLDTRGLVVCKDQKIKLSISNPAASKIELIYDPAHPNTITNFYNGNGGTSITFTKIAANLYGPTGVAAGTQCIPLIQHSGSSWRIFPMAPKVGLVGDGSNTSTDDVTSQAYADALQDPTTTSKCNTESYLIEEWGLGARSQSEQLGYQYKDCYGYHPQDNVNIAVDGGDDRKATIVKYTHCTADDELQFHVITTAAQFSAAQCKWQDDITSGSAGKTGGDGNKGNVFPQLAEMKPAGGAARLDCFNDNGTLKGYYATNNNMYDYGSRLKPIDGGYDITAIMGGPLNATSATIKPPSAQGDTNPSANGSADSKPTCQGGAMGWILCPAIEYVRQVTNAVANVLSDFLQLQPFTTASYNGAPYATWNNVRNIANIAFVIAFMIIIFSQATSVGISSYGVKRLLPRLIAAAILVNISFFVCALLVDISNLLGSGISGLFSTLAGGNGGASIGSGVANFVIGNSLIDGALLVAGGVILVLFFFVPTLIAILATLFVLGFREALIILLVIISPLAFVAYLLPNTEKWFKKWQEMFVGMLFLYPMVMLVFSAASVAALIIAGQKVANTSGVPSSITSVLPALIALIVQALPLIALPALFKIAMGALGTIHAQASKLSQGAISRSRIGQRYEMNKANRQAVRKSAAGERYARGLSSSRVPGLAGLRRVQAGGLSGTGKQRLDAIVEQQRGEETKQAHATLEHAGIYTPSQLADIAQGKSVKDSAGNVVLDGSKSEAVRRAAIQKIIQAGDAEQLERLMTSDGSHHEMLQHEIGLNYSTVKAAGAHLVDPALLDGKQHTEHELHTTAVSALGKLSHDKLAASDAPSVRSAAEGFAYVSEDQQRQLQASAQEILANPEILKAAKAGTREALEDIASRTIAPPLPPPTP